MRLATSSLVALLSLAPAHAFLNHNPSVHHRNSHRSPAQLVKKHEKRDTSTPSGNSNSNYVATTWYAGWHSSDFPPEDISWSKYTSVTYAFAVTTPNCSEISLAPSDATLLPQFVSLAHQNNVKAGLSVGGWGGSEYFSSAVATAANRTAFVNAVTNLVSTYSLDAIDFDWEYPGTQGIGCNVVNPNDTANYLSFLQQLRPALPANFTLSAAVSLKPFMGPSGTPSTDVSAFSQVLDYIAVMNYDVWGPWSATTGPNAPLNDTCAQPSQQVGSAVSAVKAWTGAGFPAKQIVLGVASYGHSWQVTPSAALSPSTNTVVPFAQFVAGVHPQGDAWDAAGPDACGVNQPFSGDWDFWGLVSGGYLNENGTANQGIDYVYDSCSETPYVYNATAQIMVAYDDATSFAAKGSFIQSSGLGGFSMWQAGGDYDDILLNSIRGSLGLPNTGDDGECSTDGY